MPQMNALRLQVQEGSVTLTQDDLARALIELDMRVMGANCWTTNTYDGDGILEAIDYYSDAGKTKLVMRDEFTFISGVGGQPLLSEMDTIIYNDDLTEDSRVTHTINRTNPGTDDTIEGCDSPMTTGEDTKI